MSDGVDPTAHEIIVLSPEYQLSVHFPQGSLYVDVWLGINNRTDDLLLHLSELRRKALDTSPAEEMATSPMSTASTSSPDFPLRTSPPSRSRSTSSSTVTMASQSAGRRDSVCDQQQQQHGQLAPQNLSVSIRHSDHGLFNCPPDTPMSDWLVSKESIAIAQSICQAHHAKFHQSVEKIQKYHRGPRIPDLDPLKRLLDDFLAQNNQSPGALTAPACCICSASPYTRLFFSML
ncbi:hypothetical protein IW140_005388 [Coemansia sp. RSA 1813]|nr:hypothetical protein EV178_005493 [Coemansia sp. RSA 1646]KAJ1769030.1 hypothetical protein LPJ74_004394 [Coemansia sp. RSA 1843]KAJ2086658.1 hypothetical protein IW138_005529 [Coemansia sp. RSA 986]KAJ2211447.1 hypothetical protein EV179_005489 [Coemansia sp. RSA 487]KAJ2565275.1 hypothetical protein IW140_005388 [Coemansia sp. RSA 1813]